MHKNIVREYIDYLKDNPERYWFKRKIYGWGWTPATVEGWVVLIIFLGLIILNFYRLGMNAYSSDDTVRLFFIQTLVLVFILLAICYKKGEKPKWQWGLPKKDGDDGQL